MAELELTRSPDDRRLFTLGGVGALRLGGWLSRGATAEAGAASWQLARRGFSQTTIEAVDITGTVVGRFTPRTLRRGGTLSWSGRELALRPSSAWRERYALVESEDDDDRELATIESKSWGRRPVKLTLDDADALDPGLLLFAVFVVRALAEDAAAASPVV